MWSKAFWKDALERTISAVCQSLLLFLSGDVIGEVGGSDYPIQVDFSQWETWLNVIAGAAILQMLKNFIAVTANPNTGASFGASIPGTLVQAYTSVTRQSSASGDYVAHPGDTVAGPAAELQAGVGEGEPVYVKPVPPSEPPKVQ